MGQERLGIGEINFLVIGTAAYACVNSKIFHD